MLRQTLPARRIHLVDIENLLGLPRPSAAQASTCRAQYNSRAAVQPDDLVVVACNHGAALAVGYSWRGARLLLRSGRNGADRALLDVIAREKLEQRFSHVVVASGDGCFADAIARLASHGTDVTVISNRRALSRRLRLAAKHVMLFDSQPLPAGTKVVPLKAA